MKYLDVFLQMECDLQKLNIQIPARPSTQSPADLTAVRDAYASQQIDIYESEKVPKMREAAKGRGTKNITFNNYILDRRGPHDWRESKNPTRDFPRVALISFVEPHLVRKYRKDLITKSSAAQFLRATSQQLLSRFSKPRQIIKPSTQKLHTIRRYDFPDGLKAAIVELDEVEVDDLLGELADARNIVEHLESLKGTIKKLENLPFAFARPELALIAPRVKEKMDSLCEVRFITHFLFSVFYVTVATLGLRG